LVPHTRTRARCEEEEGVVGSADQVAGAEEQSRRCRLNESGSERGGASRRCRFNESGSESSVSMEMEKRDRESVRRWRWGRESERAYVTPLILDAQYLKKTPTQGKPVVAASFNRHRSRSSSLSSANSQVVCSTREPIFWSALSFSRHRCKCLCCREPSCLHTSLHARTHARYVVQVLPIYSVIQPAQMRVSMLSRASFPVWEGRYVF
jgi:hypothetical protein